MNAELEYLEAKVLTARPEQLHLMVVEGALRHARKAEIAAHDNNREQRHEQLGLARDYISELIGGLNQESDKNLVGPVAQLFVFVYRRLVEADADHGMDKIRDAIHILEMHRETWLELIETRISEAATNETPANVPEAPKPHMSFDSATQPAPEADDYQPRSWST
ncbi:flagellar export chaperone FliS [Calycomorphotria hydatis]|uniref:Flagellar protein FliS n=1 Tax=Calycomorphotria hydatis TaxID=2528027 RepID=A0A517TDW4_9PLAN|nr:flagellar export chaperone FliS [Calycomorphotria hydatis]QDT66556.1 Flagellar protein FliS [Calycomorphotria hydatis]